jgi:hypothetical protein
VFAVLASSGTIECRNLPSQWLASGIHHHRQHDRLNGTVAQTVPAFNFNNLTISGSRTTFSVTLVNGGTIGVAGTFAPRQLRRQQLHHHEQHD